MMILWQVAVSRLGLPILGTGSADQTAKVATAGDNQACPEDLLPRLITTNKMRFQAKLFVKV